MIPKICKTIKITDSMILDFHKTLLNAIKTGSQKEINVDTFSVYCKNPLIQAFQFQFCAIPLKGNRAFVFSNAILFEDKKINFLVFPSRMCLYEAEDIISSENFMQKFKKYLESKFLDGALTEISNAFDLENSFIVKVIQYRTVDVTYQTMEDLCKNHLGKLQSSQCQNFLSAGGAISSYHTLVNLSYCKLNIKLLTYDISNLKHQVSLLIQDNATGNSMNVESHPILVEGELNPVGIATALNRLLENKDTMPENIFSMMQDLGFALNIEIPMLASPET